MGCAFFASFLAVETRKGGGRQTSPVVEHYNRIIQSMFEEIAE
jgi:hypothetical protein